MLTLGTIDVYYLHEAQIALASFKFPFLLRIFDAKTALSIVCLDFFDRFNHMFDALVLGH